MDYVAVIDTSSVLWDPADFEANTAEYYELKTDIIQFIDKVEIEKPPILLRSQLLNQMLSEFPYNQLDGKLTDFKNIFLRFLGRIGSEIIEFEPNDASEIISIPEIMKKHYSAEVIQEIKYLLNEIHHNNNRTTIYFTFKYLWGENGNLNTTEAPNAAKEHQTIVCSSEELNKYFQGLKKIFVHSEKHHLNNEQGDYHSPLTCYKNKDATKPQGYLDSAVQIGNKHINYDSENKVWVVFFCTGGNEYHGHDEIDENKIPAKARKVINKNA
jgi:hypothetical protein